MPAPRADDVARPDLVDRLPTTEHGKLVTLVLAPAGWGKTTLLGQWATTSTAPDVALLLVDERDNDVVRFLDGLHAGLSAVVGELPELEQQPSASSWIDYTLPAVVDELPNHGRTIAICLDDYQHVSEPDVHTVVQALVEGLPDNAHLVVGSRIDPPLRLARMRASRQIEEIRVADLQFSVEDTSALFQSAFGLDLDASLVATLHARTEGWPAGISLAGVTLRSSNDATTAIEALPSTDRLIFEYLSEEMLEALTRCCGISW